MVIDMLDAMLATLSQIRKFMARTADVPFRALDGRAERYAVVHRLLRRLDWTCLRPADKTLLKAFLGEVTGLFPAQLTRLIGHVRTGVVRVGYRAPASAFRGHFDATDVTVLAELDAAPATLSGPAAQRLCQRAWQVYGDVRYRATAGIAVAHLYNLRKRTSYRAPRASIDKTRSHPGTIAIRRAPQPDGHAGLIRIDTVHQGDSDSAMEFVNRDVARLLEKLRVQFTRSRRRRCGDYALVEAKNGAVIRRIMS